MSEYRIVSERAGKGMGVLWAIVVVMGLIAVGQNKGWVDTVAAGPFLLLGFYLAATLWRNDAGKEVGPQGIRIWTGPLPIAERERWIPREAIAEVCVRQFTINRRFGGRFRTAGVVLRDGDCLDIYVSCPPHPEAEMEARKIAEALGMEGEITHYDRPGRVRRRRAMVLLVLRNAGVVALFAAWVFWVETTFGKWH